MKVLGARIENVPWHTAVVAETASHRWKLSSQQMNLNRSIENYALVRFIILQTLLCVCVGRWMSANVSAIFLELWCFGRCCNHDSWMIEQGLAVEWYILKFREIHYRRKPVFESEIRETYSFFSLTRGKCAKRRSTHGNFPIHIDFLGACDVRVIIL